MEKASDYTAAFASWVFSRGFCWAWSQAHSAKFIIPGNDPGGCFLTIIIGIVARSYRRLPRHHRIPVGARSHRFDIRSILIATVGAAVLLLIFRLTRGGR